MLSEIVTGPSNSEAFFRDGFFVARGVFGRDELVSLAEHVLHVSQPTPEQLERYGGDGYPLRGRRSLGDLSPAELRMSERLLRLHLFDPPTRALMLDPRLFALVRPLWPGEPLAVHALYFPKPPGARGMALHADTGYLPVDPPELVGCFVAVDDCDAQNGALGVVRGSHRFDAIERRTVSTDEVIFPEEFIPPPGSELVVPELRAGDVLVFHGKSLHSSAGNRTQDRWRRAFICHYVSSRAQRVSEYLNPAYTAAGEERPAPGHDSVKLVEQRK